MTHLPACLCLSLLLVAAPAMPANRLQNIIDDAWATSEGQHFSGRLTEAHPAPAPGSGARTSLYRYSRQLLASGEEGRVTWNVGALQWQTRADDHGYWELQTNQPLAAAALEPGWHAITGTPAASSVANLLVHDPRNTLGVISDIDDTILVSEVNHTGRLLRNSLTLPPEAREAVPGMAALLQAWLQKNPNPQATPVFYVSATPRQLSDGIRRFLRGNGFPTGVLQLKEVGTASSDPLTDQQAYKVARISAILKAFPDVRFALLGDDGERDPETFAQLLSAFPNQITGAWIRHVNPDPNRVRHEGQHDMAELLSSGPP